MRILLITYLFAPLGLILTAGHHTLDGQGRPASMPTLFGISGAVATPTAMPLPLHSGTVGIWESVEADSLDAVYFAYGIAEALEIGLLSKIPNRPGAAASFFFKYNGLRQDRLFRGSPSMTFGLHKENSFVASSYSGGRLAATLGYNLADGATGMFANAVLHPASWIAVAGEFVGDEVGAGLRLFLSSAELALVYSPYSLGGRLAEHMTHLGLRYRF